MTESVIWMDPYAFQAHCRILSCGAHTAGCKVLHNALYFCTGFGSPFSTFYAAIDRRCSVPLCSTSRTRTVPVSHPLAPQGQGLRILGPYLMARDGAVRSSPGLAQEIKEAVIACDVVKLSAVDRRVLVMFCIIVARD